VLQHTSFSTQLRSTGRDVSFRHVEQGDSARSGLGSQPGADSISDSNTGGSRRPTPAGCAGGAQVANVYERL
jgi:hypothetical protein